MWGSARNGTARRVPTTRMGTKGVANILGHYRVGETIIPLAKAAHLRAQQSASFWPDRGKSWYRDNSRQDKQVARADASNEHGCKDYHYDEAYYATDYAK